MSKITNWYIPSTKGGKDVSLHYKLSVVQVPKLTHTTSATLLKSNTPETKECLSEPNQSAVLWRDISRWFGEEIRRILTSIQDVSFEEVEELRLRVAQPLLIRTSDTDYFINQEGRVTTPEKAYFVNREDLAGTLERMTHSSVYAAEEDLKIGRAHV